MPSAKDKSSVAKQAAENATGFVLGATLAAPQKSFIFVERISVLEEFESQSLSAACKAMCRSRKRLKTNAGDGRNWRFYSGTGSVILIGAIRLKCLAKLYVWATRVPCASSGSWCCARLIRRRKTPI